MHVAKDLIVHLRDVVLAAGDAALTDGQLLEEFINQQEDAAITTLVQRHGQMVWGVCRRVLSNHHDAEDAFQATFLVLIRKAASIRPREMVGNWLYGVAHQTALKARATIAKRQTRERQVTDTHRTGTITEREVQAEVDRWLELEPLLDKELSSLPDKYRAVIVLCDLEGKTRKEVARQLQIPEGTLSSRLTTARTMLARRLSRHGLPMSGGAVAVALSQEAASAAVPVSLVSSTIKAASLYAAGQAAIPGVISIKVSALTEGVMKTMLLTKLRIALVAFVAVLLVFVSGVLTSSPEASRTVAAEDDKTDTSANAQKKEKGDTPVVKVTAHAVLNAFMANDASADEQFTGKQVQVTGSSGRIFHYGEKYVLVMNNIQETLWFEFDANDQQRRKQLIPLGRGAIVTIQGQCYGRTTVDAGGRVEQVIRFRNCQIVKVGDEDVPKQP